MLKKKKILNDFERSSQLYFKEISNFNPLSQQEELSLWERYKKHNDIDARDKIVKSNLRFVARVAKSYQGMGLSYADLIAEGNVGLMKAMDLFDYKRGYKTISYSVWWIKQSILEALQKRNGLPSEELPSDFEKPMDSEDDEAVAAVELPDWMEESADDEMRDIELKKALSLMINCLSSREKDVIVKYYGLDNTDEMTLEDIGRSVGLTKERVRQIKEKALKKLRAEAINNSITSDIYY